MGNRLTAAQNTEYLRNYPWLLAPGAAIFITVLAFNFLGDGLRDAADTKTYEDGIQRVGLSEVNRESHSVGGYGFCF